MKKNGAGLTSAERERLTGQPQGAAEMDFKASALVFASLLLILALFVAASLIARSQVERDTGAAPVSHTTVEGTAGAGMPDSPEPDNQEQAQVPRPVPTGKSPGQAPGVDSLPAD